MAEPLVCNACVLSINSDEERSSHYKSEWHRYNVKRRCAGLGPITQELFTQKLDALQLKQSKGAHEKTVQTCDMCNKKFKSVTAFQRHLESKTHKKKSEKPSSSSTPASASTPLVSSSISPPVVPASSLTATSENPGEMEIEDEKDLKEDKEEGEGDGKEDQPIGLKCCLFCSATFHKSTSLQDSLDHMLKVHGFFIPFIEYMVDLEGFLTYLGAKVGIGHVCLYCNGRGRASYPSLHAVRQHMLAKSHCKIRLETEDDEDEFLEFFDFEEKGEGDEEEEEGEDAAPGEGKKEAGKPGADEPMSTEAEAEAGTSSALVDPSQSKRRAMRGASGITEHGELVLASGAIIGHRALKTIYRQNVRPRDSRESVLIARMMSSYKSLKLDGYDNNKGQGGVSERTLYINKLHYKKMMKLGVSNNMTTTRKFRKQMMC